MSFKQFAMAVLAVAVAGAAVLGANGGFDRGASSKLQSPAHLLHASCAEPGGADQMQHVPERFAKALALTAAQSAEIDRLAVEACAAMARIHEGLLGVLTAEQRQKLANVHRTEERMARSWAG
jgi:hypothetical protein